MSCKHYHFRWVLQVGAATLRVDNCVNNLLVVLQVLLVLVHLTVSYAFGLIALDGRNFVLRFRANNSVDADDVLALLARTRANTDCQKKISMV